MKKKKDQVIIYEFHNLKVAYGNFPLSKGCHKPARNTRNHTPKEYYKMASSYYLFFHKTIGLQQSLKNKRRNTQCLEKTMLFSSSIYSSQLLQFFFFFFMFPTAVVLLKLVSLANPYPRSQNIPPETFSLVVLLIYTSHFFFFFFCLSSYSCEGA